MAQEIKHTLHTREIEVFVCDGASHFRSSPSQCDRVGGCDKNACAGWSTIRPEQSADRRLGGYKLMVGLFTQIPNDKGAIWVNEYGNYTWPKKTNQQRIAPRPSDEIIWVEAGTFADIKSEQVGTMRVYFERSYTAIVGRHLYIGHFAESCREIGLSDELVERMLSLPFEDLEEIAKYFLSSVRHLKDIADLLGEKSDDLIDQIAASLKAKELANA